MGNSDKSHIPRVDEIIEKGNAYSTMALDRIQEVRVIPMSQLEQASKAEQPLLEYKPSPIADWDAEVFEYLVGPSWPEDVWETPSRMKRPEPIEVAFSPRRLNYEKTKPLHGSFSITNRFWGPDNWPIVKYRVHLNEEFTQQILMRQPNAVVLSPPEAVGELRTRIEKSKELWG